MCFYVYPEYLTYKGSVCHMLCFHIVTRYHATCSHVKQGHECTMQWTLSKDSGMQPGTTFIATAEYCIPHINFPSAKTRTFQENDLNINTLRPRQNGRRFADDTFKRIFLNENVRILIKISLKFVPKGPINNIPALVQIRAWRGSGDKPLSEPMLVSLLTHICVTRPQWVIVTLQVPKVGL